MKVKISKKKQLTCKNEAYQDIADEFGCLRGRRRKNNKRERRERMVILATTMGVNEVERTISVPNPTEIEVLVQLHADNRRRSPAAADSGDGVVADGGHFVTTDDDHQRFDQNTRCYDILVPA